MIDKIKLQKRCELFSENTEHAMIVTLLMLLIEYVSLQETVFKRGDWQRIILDIIYGEIRSYCAIEAYNNRFYLTQNPGVGYSVKSYPL